MTAGREVDALVAEKVMGRDMAKPEGFKYPIGLPHYSTDIAAAWMVVESAACESGHKFLLTQEHGLWTARVSGMYEADAETAELAICLAALRAVGEGV